MLVFCFVLNCNTTLEELLEGARNVCRREYISGHRNLGNIYLAVDHERILTERESGLRL